jgi:hypothetical protein
VITPAQLLEHYSKLQDPTGELLPRLIGRADMLASAYCGLPRNSSGVRTLASSTYVLYPVPSLGQPRALDLRLFPTPVDSITSVYVDEDWDYGSGDLVASTEYTYADDSGLLWLKPTSGSAWSTSPRANKVTLVAGYDLVGEEPNHSLVAILASIVQALIDRPHLQSQAAATLGGASITTNDLEHLIPAAARAALDAECRIWSVACG